MDMDATQKYVDAVLAKPRKRHASYVDYLPESGVFTEGELWDALAEANGLDVSNISDGDLAEWL